MLENVKENFVPVVERINSALVETVIVSKAATEALVSFRKALHPLALLVGPGRYRKPYVKQPGVQFAIFAEGRLTQYKRLTNGSIVKV